MIVGRPGFAETPAVRADQLYEVKSAIILQPGPAALTDGAAELGAIVAAVAHGERLPAARGGTPVRGAVGASHAASARPTTRSVTSGVTVLQPRLRSGAWSPQERGGLPHPVSARRLLLDPTSARSGGRTHERLERPR